MASTATASLQFRLLGPLEVLKDGAPLRLGGERQRGLLALLLLHANELVTTDQLVEQLFGANATDASVRAVRVAVSRLRRLLDEETLVTRPGGYVVYADPSQLDVAEFEAHVMEGRIALEQGMPTTAAASFRQALALFRGPPLADLAMHDFVQPEARRLEELRLSALMDRIDADLAVGRGADLVPELEGLAQANPFQERLRSQLMLALYRSGRQSDALDVYRRTRELLAEELGLEPSRALQQLERAILQHDPTLEAPSVPRDVVSELPSVQGVGRLKRRHLVAVALAALAGVVVATALLARGSSPVTAKAPTALGKHLVASIASPLPSCCGFGFGAVWIVGHHDETVEKVDPSTNKVVARYRIAGFQALEPLVAAGSLWVPASGEPKFIRFDPARRKVVATIRVEVAQLAWGYDSIWATTRDHHLLRVDLKTNRIVKRLQLLPGYNDFDDDVAVGYGSIWVTATDTATLLRIDPTTVKVVGRLTGFGDDESWMPVTIGDGSVWVYRITNGQGVVYRIDPYTNQIVARIRVGHPNVAWPNGYIVDAGGYVWIGDAGSTLSVVDPRTNRVVAWFTLPETTNEVEYGDGSIWISLYDHSRVYRLKPSP